jgi:hypothetical protein
MTNENMFGFDLQSTEVASNAGGSDFEVLPQGWYDAVVDRSEATQTAKGDDCLKMTFRINAGKYTGRLIFSTFVYGHPKEIVANIARGQMAKIAQIAEINPVDADGFAGARVGIKLAVRPAAGQYGASNDVKVIGPVPEAAPAPANGATSADGKVLPW